MGSGDMERFTVEQDGFFGFLHLPERHVEAYSGKAARTPSPRRSRFSPGGNGCFYSDAS